ncbi:MAG: cell division protein FtsW [Candidatus Yonathbacteria bacterium]|nr:cell division protein FtsW [Candidatus Yonathbacteria bacterium]
MKIKKIDKIFLALSVTLVFVGFFVFTSASFGLFVRKGFSLGDILFSQALLGIFLGTIALFVFLYLPLRIIRKYSLYIFIGSALMTLLVFVPGIGFAHGGAHRWILLGPLSFQPSEILKLGTVIYSAALIALFKERLSSFKYALGFTALITVIPAIILLAEPDTGTFVVLFIAISSMLIAGGMKLRHFLVLILISFVAVAVLALVRPYIKDRVLTFFDPSRDPQGASYQIQKSFIAIGSGGITGRGFGQSIQKFGSLPEPTGDSVFAVVGEEFGFVGGTVIIILFFLFGLRGLRIAHTASDPFSGLLAVGIVILIVSQSFMNIAAMLGLIPLTGVPLVFISHGGTAILLALLEIGILLNISKGVTASKDQRAK